MTLILRSRGYEVLPALTLQDAKRLMEEPSLVAIILDLMLPDGDGIEILRDARARSMPARVLVTTASSDVARLDRVRAFNPEGLFRKPIHLPDLLDALKGV